MMAAAADPARTGKDLNPCFTGSRNPRELKLAGLGLTVHSLDHSLATKHARPDIGVGIIGAE